MFDKLREHQINKEILNYLKNSSKYILKISHNKMKKERQTDVIKFWNCHKK